MRLDIKSFIGPRCITGEDGQRLYDKIYPELTAGKKVFVDFQEVAVFASPFFNFAFGQLLRDLNPDRINDLLVVENLVDDGMSLLRRVVKNAWEYYTKPDTKKVIDDIFKKQMEEGA